MSTLTSVSGFPRIGQNRELKKIIEGYWKGANDLAAVKATAAELRAKHWKLQQAAGIDLIPSNDFSYYDQMLDTAILLNVIPQRYARLSFDNQEDTLFAMARGYQGDKGDVTALPMKKWFTTNYHYLVPEVESAAEMKLNSTKPFDEFNEAKALGIDTKPVFIGPYTFLKLARTPEATELELDKGLVNAVAAVYAEVLAKFNELGAAWVQLDEPYLVLDKEPGDVELFKTLYTKILSAKGNVKVLLNTYFGHIADVYETVNLLGFDGIGLDLNEGREENLEAVAKYGVASNTTIFAGVINGRNIWRNNYATSLGLVDALKQVTNVAVSTASSLLHVPFSTEGETGIPAEDLKHFAFAVQKLDELKEVAALADATEDEKKASAALAANQALFDGTRVAADPAVAERIGKLSDADYVRQPAREERQALQREALGLPLLPTTTIGSFPQTKEIRAERAKLRKGEVTKEAYDEFIKAQIDAVIKKQEEIGLDVLVHGEFERNDMVEYFGQNLNGFLFTKNAWVQSYGTRCVKPPIVWGDVSRANPITVEWSAYAQSKTDHVMKGMLTGPVTILNWSWPREDITTRSRPSSSPSPSATKCSISRPPVSRSSRSMRPPCVRSCRCASPTGTSSTSTGPFRPSVWCTPPSSRPPRSTPTCATPSSTTSSATSTRWMPTSSPSKPPVAIWWCSTPFMTRTSRPRPARASTTFTPRVFLPRRRSMIVSTRSLTRWTSRRCGSTRLRSEDPR